MDRYKEAIEAIKSNYPPENYTILREGLDLAIEVLEKQIPWQTETLFKILDYMKKEGITEEELMLNWALTRLKQRGLEKQHIREIVENILSKTSRKE